MLGAAIGVILALSGLGVIFGRRIAGGRGGDVPVSEPTRLFVGVSLVVVGHQLAAHSLPGRSIGPTIPLGLAWIPGTMIVLGLGVNLWMDRRRED